MSSRISEEEPSRLTMTQQTLGVYWWPPHAYTTDIILPIRGTLENQRNTKLEEGSRKDRIKVYMPDSHSSHPGEGLSCLSLGKSVV